MKVDIEKSWRSVLHDDFDAPYFTDLASFVKDEYAKQTIFPRPKNIFKALNECPLQTVRVVILGQDPYHGELNGQPQAQGFSFSVPADFPLPPSLKNIYKELKEDIGVERKNGDLSDWAKQGVLLLNATLTVRAHRAGSHQSKGWERFTDSVIKTVSETNSNVVFILWGSYARSKKSLINTKKHFIIESPHPSPLSAHRGFFGSKPFSKTNVYLKEHQLQPINWS